MFQAPIAAILVFSFTFYFEEEKKPLSWMKNCSWTNLRLLHRNIHRKLLLLMFVEEGSRRHWVCIVLFCNFILDQFCVKILNIKLGILSKKLGLNRIPPYFLHIFSTIKPINFFFAPN